MGASLSRNTEYKMLTFHTNNENLNAVLMDIHLYVFGQEGNLIESQAIRQGKAVIAITEDEMRNAKIVIAPALEEFTGEPLSLAKAIGRHVFVADVALDAGQSSYELPPVPEVVWRWWLVHNLWKDVKADAPKKAWLPGW